MIALDTWIAANTTSEADLSKGHSARQIIATYLRHNNVPCDESWLRGLTTELRQRGYILPNDKVEPQCFLRLIGQARFDAGIRGA